MSDRIRVLLTKQFFQEDIDYISSNLSENVSLVNPPEFTEESIKKTVQDNIHVLLGSLITRSILDNATSLQLIQIPWTGIDTLDFRLLREYDIAVCNSHSNARVVAEYALALMMATVKQIPLHDRELRQGKWCRPMRKSESFFMPPITINGKTVGFIGYGAIAKEIAQLLTGFSVEMIAVAAHTDRVSPPEPLAFIGGDDKIDFVVGSSDFLFITLPLTNKTKGLFGESLLMKMKPSAYLINISRGEVLDEDALYCVLKNRHIAGAAIDTWYNYPTPDCPDVFPSKKNRFHELDNLVLSPHRAGFAEGRMPHLDDAIENINRLVMNRPLINLVDLEAGY